MPIDFDTLRSILPIQSLMRGNFVVLSSKETDTLLDIWNGTSDPFGRNVLPKDIDRTAVASLVDKGMLETDKPNSGIVVITSKAKEVIKRKILQETSTFDQKSGVKIASRTINFSRSVFSDNWLKRVVDGR